MLKVTKKHITALIRQELQEIMDLPSDLSTPASEAELKMDAMSSSWEKLIADRILDGEAGIWSNTIVVDPIDGEGRLLDEFLSILGNYVVSDEIDEGDANDLVRSIANEISRNRFEPSPHEWGIAPPKWEGKPFEPAGRPRRPEGLEEGMPESAGHLEPADAILGQLRKVVESWKPQTPEGQKYEADILDLLERFNMSSLEEERAPFPAGSRVRHEDYGSGTVTHAGTKHTNVAVKFDNEGRDGKKNRQVSRGSLKRAK